MKTLQIIDDLQEPKPIHMFDFIEALFNTEVYYPDDNGEIDEKMNADLHLEWFFGAYEFSEKKPKDERTFYLYNKPFYWICREDIEKYEKKSLKGKVLSLFDNSNDGKTNKKSWGTVN